MGITQSYTDSFLVELLSGIHDFTQDRFAFALITSPRIGDYGSSTTNYSNLGVDEVTSRGYTPGGIVLPNLGIGSQRGEAFVRFGSIRWGPVRFTRGGGLLYNTTKGNRSVMIKLFEVPVVLVNASLILTLPGLNPTRALVQLT